MIVKRLNQGTGRLESTSRKAVVAVIACVSLLILTFDVAAAAPPGGSVAGTVKDALQRPLGGAAVRLESPDG